MLVTNRPDGTKRVEYFAYALNSALPGASKTAEMYVVREYDAAGTRTSVDTTWTGPTHKTAKAAALSVGEKNQALAKAGR